MGAFSRKYSQEQTDAVVGAILDGVDGLPGRGPEGTLTAPQAVKAAGEGKLGLPAFEFTLPTARHYAQMERQRRAGKTASRADRKPPLDVCDETIRRMTRVVDMEANKILKLPSNRPLDAERVIRLLKAAEQIAKTTRAVQQGTGPQAVGKGQGDEPTEVLSLVTQLAAQAREQATPSDKRSENEEAEGQRQTAAQRQTRTPPHDTTGFLSRVGDPLAAAQALLKAPSDGPPVALTAAE